MALIGGANGHGTLLGNARHPPLRRSGNDFTKRFLCGWGGVMYGNYTVRECASAQVR